jgi:transposase
MEAVYKLAGIDVHKKMLAVVVTNVAELGEDRFERRKFGTGESELKALAVWLSTEGVQEVVMESTAQYWKPVWQMLEGSCELHLAQAQSNRAPKGRKSDFADAQRLVRSTSYHAIGCGSAISWKVSWRTVGSSYPVISAICLG